MHPAIRQPTDNQFDVYSDATGIAIDTDDPKENLTRQEDATDADINVIIQRFHRTGQLPPNKRVPIYTETNFDATLQDHMHSIIQARDLLTTLPKTILDKYPTDGDLLVALGNGELIKDLESINNPKPESTGNADAAADTDRTA